MAHNPKYQVKSLEGNKVKSSDIREKEKKYIQKKMQRQYTDRYYNC